MRPFTRETGRCCGECGECVEPTIGEGADGADEVIVEAIFWDHQLVSVEIKDTTSY